MDGTNVRRQRFDWSVSFVPWKQSRQSDGPGQSPTQHPPLVATTLSPPHANDDVLRLRFAFRFVSGVQCVSNHDREATTMWPHPVHARSHACAQHSTENSYPSWETSVPESFAMIVRRLEQFSWESQSASVIPCFRWSRVCQVYLGLRLNNYWCSPLDSVRTSVDYLSIRYASCVT